MAVSYNFLVINMVIIFFNAIIVTLMNFMILNYNVPPVYEHYVQLMDNPIINDPQLLKNLRDPASALFGRDNGCNGSEACCQDPKESLINPSLDPSRGLLDKSGKFKIHAFTVSPENSTNDTSEPWNICLSTQTTVNFLFWLKTQIKMWQGPMSVAVFTPGIDYTIAIRMIRYLQTCYPEVKERVAFHFVYPKNMPPIFVNFDGDKLEYDCDQSEPVNNELMNLRSLYFKKLIKKLAYPQNLLRNLAREGCQAEYSYTPDMDMILTPGMSRQLNEFLSSNSTRICDKCAYVMPAYEIHRFVKRNPVDKNELLALIKKRYAQRFHKKVFTKNQGNSQLERWENASMSGKLKILYNITTWQTLWEPIYITKATVPFYDERFIGYGRTRSSQVFEMHEAGYSFFMLNNAFLCHRGFQTARIQKGHRQKQIYANAGRFERFEAEIHARYHKEENVSPSVKEMATTVFDDIAVPM